MESLADKAGLVAGLRHDPRQRAAASPVSFAGTFGLFQAADGLSSGVVRNAAVLFVPPWGFEEMCTHKLFRIMAEEFAADGIASLRFDYPGAGDALDGPPDGITLALWQETVVAALKTLREKAGGVPVMLVGHGLGASLALEMAKELDGEGESRLCGLVGMAPVSSGRSYLRELQFWAQVIDDGLGLDPSLRLRDVTAIAGHIMPDGVSAALKKKDFSATVPHHSIPHLFVNRPERPSDAQLAEKMAAKGARVEMQDYAGFDAMVANPSLAQMPYLTLENVVSWVVCRAAALGKPDAVMAEAMPESASLEAGEFHETAMRFGRNNRLYGILCEPKGERLGATVLLMGTAYDRQAGWGRATVAMARRLAGAGIASFRFDPANVGDSPPVPGLPEQVLYAETQYDDVEAALNMFEARDLLPAMAVGRCSGAYLAFSSSTKDHRLVGMCLANPYAFYWDPACNVDGVLRVVPRSLDTYTRLMFTGGTFRRLFRGEIDVKNAARNFLSVMGGRIVNGLRLGNWLTARARMAHAQVRSAFARLAKRKVKMVLLYSENDIGLEHVYQHFGAKGQRLARYPNVKMAILPGMDHNLSPASAQKRYFEEIRDLALSFSRVCQGKVDPGFPEKTNENKGV
jgi:pimeloyl-ACP methyl ester carboxylesterase